MSNREPFNILGEWRYGKILYNRHDVYIGRSLALYGEYSEGEVDLFRQLLGPGMVVLDVGANIGCHTIPMASMVGDDGTVIAFEPQRIVFQTLCANVALSSIKNVVAKQIALGSQPALLRQMAIDYDNENNFGGVPLGEDQWGDMVEVYRIDDLELPDCAFIKIDVEGMELQVLAGARRLIERSRPWLYVENDRPDRAGHLKRFIQEQGYEMFWHTPPLFNEKNFKGCPENIFGNICSINMLCIPKELEIQVPNLMRVSLD